MEISINLCVFSIFVLLEMTFTLFYSDWDLYKLIFNNHYPVIASGKFIDIL